MEKPTKRELNHSAAELWFVLRKGGASSPSTMSNPCDHDYCSLGKKRWLAWHSLRFKVEIMILGQCHTDLIQIAAVIFGRCHPKPLFQPRISESAAPASHPRLESCNLGHEDLLSFMVKVQFPSLFSGQGSQPQCAQRIYY